MRPLTPEQREYKEATLNRLLTNRPLLETQYAEASQPAAVVSLREQVADTQAHIERLKKELTTNEAGEAVADELCQRAAAALVKEKFYLARKYINKLETIEPFYPTLDYLKKEAELGRVSRRTRSLAQGTTLGSIDATLLPSLTSGADYPPPTSSAGEYITEESLNKEEGGGFRQFFQFHIVASCLVVLLVMCVMAGVGGMTILQWLIQGS